jgi:hypothetical protein
MSKKRVKPHFEEDEVPSVFAAEPETTSAPQPQSMVATASVHKEISGREFLRTKGIGVPGEIALVDAKRVWRGILESLK